MKPFCLWKLPVMLLGFGAALLLTPASKAQSEVAPDHFDGSDSRQAAATQQTPSTQSYEAKRPGTVETQNKTAASGRPLQLASARQNAVAIQDKRKTVPRKSNKE